MAGLLRAGCIDRPVLGEFEARVGVESIDASLELESRDLCEAILNSLTLPNSVSEEPVD